MSDPDVKALYAAADKSATLRNALNKATLTAFKLGLGTGMVIGAVVVALIWAIVA